MEHPFKVIIVGGSIAGLTLAHCLDRACIDYIVLEKSDNISPPVGASIGIMPNGGRILDQLGLYNAIETEIEPLDKSHICYPDGFSFTSCFPKILNERFGYPIAFLSRQKLLEIIYNALIDKSRVHLGKQAIKIEETKNKVRVYTKDGRFFDGDLVVGADGVHSRMRSEMWRLADSQRPGLISLQEKNSVFAEYACLYGISTAVPGLRVGEQVTAFYQGLTILTIHGKGGKVFWFVLQKMDKKYRYPSIPRFTDLDIERLCQRHKTSKIFRDVTFSNIWNFREKSSLVAVEEKVFKHWHYGRIVCLGDSMHTMTPNLGQGANCAIESAASLANFLNEMINIHQIQKPDTARLDTYLAAFNSSRIQRATKIVKTAAFVTRLQARDGLINYLIGRYVAPYSKDLPTEIATNVILGATRIDYIPLPKRSETNWTSSQHGHRSSRIRRYEKVMLLLVTIAIPWVLAKLLRCK